MVSDVLNVFVNVYSYFITIFEKDGWSFEIGLTCIANIMQCNLRLQASSSLRFSFFLVSVRNLLFFPSFMPPMEI